MQRRESGEHILPHELESIASGLGLTLSDRLRVLNHLVRCKHCQRQLMIPLNFLEKLQARALAGLNSGGVDELDLDWGRIRLVFGDSEIACQHRTRLIVWVV